MKTKNLFLISMAAMFLVTACSSDPKAKAKKSIEAYLKTHLNDPSSYEFVQMDSVSAYTLAEKKRQEAELQLQKTLDMNSPEATKSKEELIALMETPAYEKMSEEEKNAAAKEIVMK